MTPKPTLQERHKRTHLPGDFGEVLCGRPAEGLKLVVKGAKPSCFACFRRRQRTERPRARTMREALAANSDSLKRLYLVVKGDTLPAPEFQALLDGVPHVLAQAGRWLKRVQP